jgi:hypothetical protein
LQPNIAKRAVNKTITYLILLIPNKPNN